MNIVVPQAVGMCSSWQPLRLETSGIYMPQSFCVQHFFRHCQDLGEHEQRQIYSCCMSWMLMVSDLSVSPQRFGDVWASCGQSPCSRINRAYGSNAEAGVVSCHLQAVPSMPETAKSSR